MRVRIGVCLLLAVLARPVGAQQLPPDNHRPIALFPYDLVLTLKVQSYYLRPTPRLAFGWYAALDLAALDAAARAHGDPHALEMVGAFYIQVLRRNPALIEDFARAVTAADRTNGILLAYQIVHYAGLADATATARAKQILLDAVPQYQADVRNKVAGKGPIFYLDHPVRDAAQLDILWACYFATGNPAFLERIAGALEDWWPPAEAIARGRAIAPRANRRETEAVRERQRLIAAQAAYRYLRNNARHYPKIGPQLARIAAGRNDKVGRVLTRLLAEARALDRRLGKPPMPPAE